MSGNFPLNATDTLDVWKRTDMWPHSASTL